MSDAEIMEKYGISSKRLRKLFQRLVDLKAISHSELYDRSLLYRKSFDDVQARRKPRVSVTVPLRIYDVESSTEGLIRDISERGFRVAGISSRVGEVRTFQIPVEMFIGFEPLLVIATCVWVETKGRTIQYRVAGYEIEDISESDLSSLRKLVQLLILSKSGEWRIFR
jgi:hypothetical protein